jgi:hypothetical protein
VRKVQRKPLAIIAVCLLAMICIFAGCTKSNSIETNEDGPGPTKKSESLMIGGHKEFHVTVDAPAKDQIVDQLNEKLRLVVEWDRLRNSEGLGFAFWDEKITGSAKVMGDDWDLATYLRGLAELSREFPDNEFKIALEPDGPQLVLAHGKFTQLGEEVSKFLNHMEQPRPDLSKELSNIEVVVQASEKLLDDFVAAFENEKARYCPEVFPVLHLQRDRGKLTIAGKLNGTVDQAAFLVGRLTEVSFALSRQEEMHCRVKLWGAERMEQECSGFGGWLELRHLLSVADGPRGQQSCITEDKAKVRIGARELGNHPQAKSFLDGHIVQWSNWDQETIRLEPDGRLHVTATPRARLVSADGQWKLCRIKANDGSETDRLIGPNNTKADFQLPERILRQPRGFAEGGLFTTEMKVEALGRVRYQTKLFTVDGKAYSGGSFINIEDVLLVDQGRKALMLADLDGVQHLVTISLPALKWSAQKLWELPLEGKKLVLASDGRVLVILEEHVAGSTAHVQVLEVNGNRANPIIKNIAADFDSVAGLDKENLWLVLGRWTSPQFPDQHVEDLARIDLKNEAVVFETEKIPRAPDARLEIAAHTPAGWLVSFRWVGVYLKDGQEFRQVHKCEAEREETSVAVSPAKTLVLLSSTGDGKGRLHFIKAGGDRVSFAVAEGGSWLTWDDEPSLQR